MLGFDAENDDAIYHSSKFIEDVPLLIIAEIGRTQISVQKVLNIKKGTSFNNYRTSGHSSVVERLVANEKVEGSTPFARSKKNYE